MPLGITQTQNRPRLKSRIESLSGERLKF